jgi:hypothetical protein
MNILEQTEALKDLPDQALVQEMQMPTGMAAPIFITAELKRRKRMRDDYARREAADTPTVAEEVVMAAGMPQGGIADAARAMAPKSSIAQNTGMNEMMPRAATQAPQRMAEGGIVRMAKGGRTKVEYNGRGYFVFADGDVQDALGRPVSDELAQAVKVSLETPPERQESTASLGSEILADASPQAPGLESVLSSDRPFSPLSTEVIDTRPAVPPSLGMGGERPATLTDSTQTAINQQQALIDAMSPAFDTFGGDPLARAEQRSNLSGPSISDVSPTVDLDLTTDQRISQEDMAMAVPVPQGQPRYFTQPLSDIKDPVERGRAILAQSQSSQAQPYEGGQYTNADAIRNFYERTRGKAMTPADKAEERLLLNNMNLPSDSVFSEYAGVDNPETSMIGLDRVNYADESQDFYDDISKNLLPPKTPDQTEREDLERQKGLDAFFESQEMRGGRPGGSLPVDVLSQPVTDDTYRMPDVTGPETTASGFFPDLEQAQAADEAARQRAISELGLSPIVSGGTEYLVNDAGNMFKVAGGNLVGVSGGEAMQAIDVAQRQGADFAQSPVGKMEIGTRGVDPNTGLVDPDSPFVPASLNISGLETPDFVDKAFDSGLGSLLNRDVVSSDSPNQPPKLTPTGFSPDPEALQLDDSVVDMAAPTGTPTLSDVTALEQGIASFPASTGNVVTAATLDDGGGGGGGGVATTGGAATGLEARIAQMLSDREADRESDKWMALAQTGMALMASKNPTLGGALGEAGLAGVGALKKAKSQYDADILGLMGLEEKARSSRLSRAAALAKANKPKAMTGTERVGLLREAGNLREELNSLQADIARKGTLGDYGQVTPFTPEQLAEKQMQANILISEINKYKGMAYPQLADVQTVNP